MCVVSRECNYISAYVIARYIPCLDFKLAITNTYRTLSSLHHITLHYGMEEEIE